MKMVFIDTETTGLDPLKNKVYQLTMIYGDKELNEYIKIEDSDWDPNTLKWAKGIFPDIESKIEQNAITIDELRVKLKTFWEGNTLNDVKWNYYFTAYNADFDYNFINNSLKDVKEFFPVKKIDVLSIARFMLPELGKYKLENLVKHFNIKVEGELHDSLVDVKNTIEVTKCLYKRIKK